MKTFPYLIDYFHPEKSVEIVACQRLLSFPVNSKESQ